MSTIKIYLYIELFFLRLFKCVWDLSSSKISISMTKYDMSSYKSLIICSLLVKQTFKRQIWSLIYSLRVEFDLLMC